MFHIHRALRMQRGEVGATNVRMQRSERLAENGFLRRADRRGRDGEPHGGELTAAWGSRFYHDDQ